MRNFLYSLFAAVMLLSLGCTLPAMIKMAKEQGLTVEPNPLEVHNGTVSYSLSAKLPVKMLKKGTKYTLNQYYKYGEKELPITDTISFRAEDYPTSNTEQPSVTKSFSFPYDPAYKRGTLEVEGVASKGLKSSTTPRLPIATGIITTSLLVQDAYYPAYATHGYNDAEELNAVVIPDFFFEQGQSELRKSEIKSKKGVEFSAFIASKNATRKVEISGTHSPEGTEAKNETLAKDRAAAIETYYRVQMAKYDYKGQADSIQFVLNPVVRDWGAFKTALESFDGVSAEEKSAYLDITSNGKAFEEQELELEKLPSYKKVFNKIYPNLRAARTTVLVVKYKKTQAEILTLAQQIAANQIAADSLSVEELLYAASLTPSLQEKESIYKAATKKTTSAVAHNNLGAVYLEIAAKNPSASQEAISNAVTQLDLAAKIRETPETHANIATLALLQNNVEKALEFAKKASSTASGELARGVNGVKGSAEIHLAKYNDAVSSESAALPTSVNLFNLGLAKLLLKDYPAASASLASAVEKDPNFAVAYYASAVAAARTDNQEGVLNNLGKAVKINPNLKASALADLEFAKWATAEAFTAILK